MSSTYSIMQTIEDAASGKTDVLLVFFSNSSKMKKSEVESQAYEIANQFKMQNNFRRVEFDCIETNENGDRTVFKNIVLENQLFGTMNKKSMDQIIDDINKMSRQQ